MKDVGAISMSKLFFDGQEACARGDKFDETKPRLWQQGYETEYAIEQILTHRSEIAEQAREDSYESKRVLQQSE